MWCSFSDGGWKRVWLVGLGSAAALFLVVVLAYQLALARVPQHRAALERLVQSQTGLDVRFSELGLRWGWYGPEAVFRSVELGEPGHSNVLLRAPELTVGFDAWRSMRSGQLEAGRITLVAPDIDFERFGAQPRGKPTEASNTDRAKLLQRWRDGRIDVEGGTLRLPSPNGSASAFLLQIRRASVRRSGDEWNVFALVFLPDSLGRTARLVMQLNGSLDHPDTLSGSARLEARRLSFAGWRDFRSVAPVVARYVPAAGSGDATASVEFEHGRVTKASGEVRAGGVVLDSGSFGEEPLSLDRLRGEWRVTRHASDWRVRVDALEMGDAKVPAAMLVDAGPEGEWVRGTLEHAPLQSVAAIARWLAPHLALADVELGGTARNVVFDWDRRRTEGSRLHVAARLEDVAVSPASHGFSLSGMNARVAGSEAVLIAEVSGREARLDLAGAPQYPLEAVQVASQLKIARTQAGWEVSTQRLSLRHEGARLEVKGSVTGTAALAATGAAPTPQIAAHIVLTGADVPFIKRALGAGAAAAFGSASSSLLAGRVEKAEFELRGPLDQLPLADEGVFDGSMSLQNAVLSGGEQWPQAEEVAARIEWHGSRIRATVDSGRAGPFQLLGATADWQAAGNTPGRVTGAVKGRIQEAIAWLREHQGQGDYAARLGNFDLRGEANLNFDLTIPAVESVAPKARIVATFTGAQFNLVAGAAPIEDLSGSVTFDGGRLQRTTLTGAWLGGPVTLRVSERRERGKPLLAMQARGVLDVAQLTSLAGLDVNSRLAGTAEWTGDLTYAPETQTQPAQWHVRADSNLLSVNSELPEPLAKLPGTPVPLRVELSGTDSGAQLRVVLGDRFASLLALRRIGDTGWRVERGAVNLGVGSVQMPSEAVVSIQGRVAHLDLPSYLAAWQQTRQNVLVPPVRAQLLASEMAVAGRTYQDVTLLGSRTESDVQLQVESAALAGVARWPLAPGSSKPVELRFSRLSLLDRTAPGELAVFLAALGRNAHITVDDLVWDGRGIGHLTATYAAREDGVAFDDVHLTGGAHDGTGVIRCAIAITNCRTSFALESSDAQATLEDFGFRPDVSASKASFSGDFEWEPGTDKPWLASARGRLSLKLADGTTRETAVDERSAFALLAVPALVNGMASSGNEGTSALKFARLEADFDLQDGEASTSDLHFDGDAEILMRGRTGLLARDYDQQVWILKGEERLPAPVRRFGPSPRVAAAWLTLREMFAGTNDVRARATLRLAGSWDEPKVVAAETGQVGSQDR